MNDITWDGLIAAEQVALEDLYAVRATGMHIDANIVVKEMSGGLLFHSLISISRDGVVYLTARGCDVYEEGRLMQAADGWHAPKGDQRYEAPVADDSGWDGEALAGEIVRDRLALARAIGLTADDVLNEDIEVITERIAEIIAERDALKAAASTWKRAAKRWRTAAMLLDGAVVERDTFMSMFIADLNNEDTDGA